LQLADRTLIGALVLSARRSFSLPFFVATDYQSHVDGSPNGRFAVTASHSEEIFLPSRGRDFYVKSSMQCGLEDAARLTEKLASRTDEEATLRVKVARELVPTVDRPNLFTIEQRRPFGMSAVISNSVDTYFLGVHTEAADFLLWSNCDNLEEQLCDARPLDSFWFFRFVVRRDFGVVLHSRRLASRWYRYGQSSSMKDPAKRFQSIERSLFDPSRSTLDGNPN
jgi:hypothetical protein